MQFNKKMTPNAIGVAVRRKRKSSDLVYTTNAGDSPALKNDFPNSIQQRGVKNIYLTANDVGKCLNIAVKKVYEMAKKGQIPGVKIGKYWRFEESKLFEFIEQKYGNAYR